MEFRSLLDSKPRAAYATVLGKEQELMSLKQQRQTSLKTKPAKSKRVSKEDAEGDRIFRKGKRLYQTKLKSLLEPLHTGKFAAIEPDSGEYFLGTKMIEAVLQARAKYPDKLVYIVRIGFRAAVSMRSPRFL
ncbi:MAG: hypothetical protein ACREEM_53780 [Blastocatellia bacterium]